MSGSTRLTIPVTRRQRGDAVATSPLWADGEKRSIEGRPWIGTFDSDDFVTEFFRLAQTPETAKGRIAYRDWCEPPKGVLDAAGQPLYPSDPHGPVPAVRRDVPWEGVSDVGIEPARPGDRYEDGVPAPEGEPAWFRKLYVPVHGRFHIVATELLCKQPYYPAIAPHRVLESGMIIRRMRPNGPDQPVSWEDWISNGAGRGAWVEVADAQMHTTVSGAPRPVDPADVALAEPLASRLRERLAIADDEPLGIATSSTAPLPPSEVPAHQTRTIRWGYLSLTSDELEPVDLADEETWEETLDRWTVEAHGELVERFEERALEVRQPLVHGWQERTEVLAQAPSIAKLQAFEDIVDAMALIEQTDGILGSLPRSQLASRLDDQLMEMSGAFLSELWARADDNVHSDVAWRDDALEGVRGVVHSDFTKYAALLQTSRADFEALVRWSFIERYEPVAAELAAELDDDAQLDDAQHKLVVDLSALLLRRLRAMRAYVTQRIYEHLESDGLLDLGAPGWTLDGNRHPVDAGTIWDELGPATLAGELENWIVAHEEYDRVPREWSDMDFLEANDSDWGVAVRWHRTFWGVEAALRTFDAALRPASETLPEIFDDYVARAVAACQFTLGDAKLDPSRPAERGLLAFPGVDVTRARLEEFVGTAELPAPGDPLSTSGKVPDTFQNWPQELVEQKKQQRQEVLLSRFDDDSLYAVWTWARVAGKSDCDADQLVWSRRSEPFLIADTNDLLGSRPAQFSLPNLDNLLRDLTRLGRTDAMPFAMVTTPQNSGVSVGDSVVNTRREWGVAWVCSYGIPVFTICAWVMFKIVFSLLIAVPGFIWMLLLKFCIPVPHRK